MRHHAGFQSFLGPDIDQFLAHKRLLGRRYDVEEKTLALLDAYLVNNHIGGLHELTPACVDRFLISRPRSRPRSYNHLRCTLGRLFSYLVDHGKLTETPLRSPPRRARYQRTPFIFDTTAAKRLLALAKTLPSKGGTMERGSTYLALFAVLYGLGLRVGEACRLCIKDVDLERRLLLIRDTKFYKSRLVPFGPKLEALLVQYLHQRQAALADAPADDQPLFCLRGGQPINPGTVSQTFHALVPRLHLQVPPGISAPRLHDLRHSFAVGTLTRWYRLDLDPQARLLALSTFMGHVDVNSTAVYLTTTPELLEQASRRFRAFAAATLREGAIMTPSLGPLVQSYFMDHLPVQKGLRVGSIRSYRDTIRLFLCFVSGQRRRSISSLNLDDLTFERVLAFLKHLEQERRNSVRTRNQRRAALNTFFAYVAVRVPEMLAACQQVAAIPVKRTSLPDTHYLEREEVTALFRALPRDSRFALRDRTLLLFLYNTGARVQEAADLRIEHLELEPPAKVRLHGKGDKWRVCPLWDETVRHLQRLLTQQSTAPNEPVFCARRSVPLTRFGIYKIVRRHAASWDTSGPQPRHVTPHLFRHTAAVHLLESGIEVNVIRGWLGHVSLDTTNRYAELTLRAKAEALRVCEVSSGISVASRARAAWKDDKTLLDWLDSL